jgi:hypothetical protein
MGKAKLSFALPKLRAQKTPKKRRGARRGEFFDCKAGTDVV